MQPFSALLRLVYQRACFVSLPLLLAGSTVFGQMSITGPTCAVTGTQYTYTIAGNWTSSTAMTWTVTGGTISGSNSGTPLPQIHVTFTASGTVKVTTTNPTSSTTVNVTATGPLTAGTISPSTQSINYNTIPAIGINNNTLASGGACSPAYTYQWQQSTNNTTFTNITGVTGSSLSFSSPLTQTMYYRRAVTETSSGTTVYTTSSQVIVYPQLVAGTVNNGSQSIDYNITPLALSLSGTTGGNGTYTYQWYSNAGGSWQAISDGLAGSYTPLPLTGVTSFYAAVTSNGVTVNSSVATITVAGQLQAGILSPSLVNVVSGTSPGYITCSQALGGQCSGSYTYTWQRSSDGLTWTNTGSGLYFNPGALTATTYYRLLVKCGNDTAYSSVGTATIGVVAGDMSYIRIRTLAKPGVPDTVTSDALTSPYDVQQATTYFDGLGRPIQSVAKQASPLQHDMVTVETYDPDGREVLKYLPYTASTSDGNYKSYGFSDQNNFNGSQFPNDHFFYSQANIEASALNRSLASLAQGDSWLYSGRGVTSHYLYNDVPDSVHIWNIGFATGSIPTDAGLYAAGKLSKSVTADEQGNQVIQYTDQEGHMILKKVQVVATPGTAHVGWLCTYYVYDDLGNLRFVLSPQAVIDIDLGTSWAIPTGIAAELCFRYEYDLRQRMIIKKVPGAGEAHMVYDVRDLVVMSQDSNLRSQQKWQFTCYDGLGRVDSMGLMTDPSEYNNLSYHTNLALLSATYPNVASYTSELMSRTFYDDYSAIGAASGLPATMATNYIGNSNYFVTTLNTSPTYAVGITAHPITRGLTTGTMTKVIGTTSQFLYTESFYDDRGRITQSQSINYTGGIDTATNQYDFTGKNLRSLLSHSKLGNTVQHHTVVTKNDYDQAFRLRHTWKNIDGAAADQLIDSLQYNERGQLNAKYLGNNVDSVVYTYNIRGWTNGINRSYLAGTASHYFGMELRYDAAASAAGSNSGNPLQYNGNIAGQVWKTPGAGVPREYDYYYDRASRLNKANFAQSTDGGSTWTTSPVNYSVYGGDVSDPSNQYAIGYDANGNIQTLYQQGFMIGGSAPIDLLVYSYLPGSNKLSGVTDLANNPTSQLGDFHYNSSTKGSTDYFYDGDGNLTLDNNKAITAITYNFLNLPQLIHFQGKGNINYVYAASGEKLAKVTIDSTAQHSIRTLYLDGMVYQQTGTMAAPGGATDTLQFIAHEEGRARWAYHKYLQIAPAYRMEYDFYEKDHLGNTRIVLTQEHDTTNYLATMEQIYRATESQIFGNIASTCVPWTTIPNYASIPSNLHFSVTNPNDSVSKVDYTGSSGQTSGPSLLLKVMGGDTISSISVQSYYASNTLSTTNSSFNTVLNSLAGGLMGLPAPASEGTLSGFTASGSPVYSALSTFLSTKDPAAPPNYPKAYLNWILLDDQFNYVSSSSGSVAVASTTYPANTFNIAAAGGPVVMSRNGYLYVWVSNETQGWDVFFDNLVVGYRQGPVLEENHYYPFGLTMAGISDKAIKTNYADNKYRFNKGSELQNKEFSDGTGLEWYDSEARIYDDQLGRFLQVDPEPTKDGQESLTPYQFGSNEPIRYNDPSGKCPSCILGLIIGAAVDYGAQVAKNLADGKSWRESLTHVNGTEIAISAAAGFITSGVSAIYSDAAIAGTTMLASKQVATAAVAGVTSVLNQANDAQVKGEPLELSPIKMLTDIATDKLADHIADKMPGVNISGERGQRINENVRTAESGVTSKLIDMTTEHVPKQTPATSATPTTVKLQSTPIQMPSLASRTDNTAGRKILIPKLKSQ